jgi:hypothetical protein
VKDYKKDEELWETKVILRRVKEFCLVARISNKNSSREKFTLDSTCLVRTLSGTSAVLQHSRPQYNRVVCDRLICTLKRQYELRKVCFLLHHIRHIPQSDKDSGTDN